MLLKMVAHETHILRPVPLRRRVLEFCGGRELSLFSKNNSIKSSGSVLSPQSTSTHFQILETVRQSKGWGCRRLQSWVSKAPKAASAPHGGGGHTHRTRGSQHMEAGTRTREADHSENMAQLPRRYVHWDQTEGRKECTSDPSNTIELFH